MRKVMTLCYVFDGERVLLGLKKSRLGAGKWNGFGGHSELPEERWSSDRYWFPLLLQGKVFSAKFTFAPGDIVVTHEVTEQ